MKYKKGLIFFILSLCITCATSMGLSEVKCPAAD